MKSIQKICTVDGLGRIVIPIGVRRELSLFKDDRVELSCENGAIILRKIQDNCVFCGLDENLKGYKGKYICKTCMERLTAE